MNLHTLLLKHYENYQVDDWTIIDFQDGNGQTLVAWNRAEPQPTPAELAFWDSTDSVIYEFEKAQTAKIVEISKAYETTFSVGIDCTGTFGTVTMDGGEIHAARLKNGYDLAVLNDETSMTIVDFFDVAHEDISLADVQAIMKQQGSAARANWAHKVELKRLALDATSIEQLEAIVW